MTCHKTITLKKGVLYSFFFLAVASFEWRAYTRLSRDCDRGDNCLAECIKIEDHTHGRVLCKDKWTVWNTDVYCQVQPLLWKNIVLMTLDLVIMRKYII